MNSWMTNLGGDYLLKNLVIPASHNSCAFTVDFEHTCPAPESKMLTLTNHLLMPRALVRGFVVCQELSLKEQLREGIRGLDLRVAQDKDGVMWVTHLMSCVPLKEVIAQIRTFVEENPSEWVIVNAKPSWEHRTLLSDDVMRLELERLLGESMVDPNFNLASARLSDVWGRISLMTKRDSWLQHHWANTNRIEELWESVQTQLNSLMRPFIETSFVLTARVGNFSVRRLAQAANAELKKRLPELHQCQSGFALYVSADFIDRQLIDGIVLLNRNVDQ